MDYSVLFAFGLLVLGLALIGAEMFIPSGGFISILSLACIIASGYSAFDAWWVDHPARFWWFVGSIVGLIPMTIGLMVFLLSRTKLGNRVFLEAPKLEDVTPYLHESEERKQLIGKTGETLTLMSPGGLVIVDGKRHHAESEGLMLDPKQPVKIIAVKGNRVVVRPYEPSSKPAPAANPLEPKAAPVNDNHDRPAHEQPKPQAPAEADLAESAKKANQESQPAPLDFEIPDG